MTQTERSATRIRVYLLEDHEAVRRSVADVLEEDPGITVVGDAGTAAQALREAPLVAPHVAVLDVRLPDGDGVTVCRELRSALPEVRCLMLTSLPEEDALLATVLGGASGYRLKQVRGPDLAGAVRAVAAGQSLSDPQTLATARRRMRIIAIAAGPVAGMSAAEGTMLELIGEGLTNQEIGARMGATDSAVRACVRVLLAKLGVLSHTIGQPVAPLLGAR